MKAFLIVVIVMLLIEMGSIMAREPGVPRPPLTAGTSALALLIGIAMVTWGFCLLLGVWQ